MQIQIYKPYNNNTVTDVYVATIAEAYSRAGYEVINVEKLRKPKHENTSVLVVAVKDAIIAKLKGYKKIYLWVQGIVPEESFMRNSSKLRYIILSAIEKTGLKCADFSFFVSKAMLEHFKKKYKYKKEQYYIMPCFNSEINESSFMYEGKYQNNVFLYAGGLDTWQCFEQTVELYKKIENTVPNASFRVLTKDKNTAENIIKKYNISSYSIDFKPSEQMPEEMAKAKFGFSLRQEHPVNLVSTPTKLSTYISNGVIPIYSKFVSDFHMLVKDIHFAVCAEDSEDCNLEKINQLCLENISVKDILAEYNQVFGNYYSREYHINNISKMFGKEHNLKI